MARSTLVNALLFIAILVFFSMTYYHEMLYQLPQGIHSWAQSDRLSLAINFYDKGMNFFKPATHSLYSTDGVTGVEFPLQSYLAALYGKIFGRTYISTGFRLISVIISCIGLLFLFLSCYRVTKDFIFSMVPPLFVYCSPVYVYYTCNYLPDAAACSISFIAFYFLLRYINSSARQPLLLAMTFFTLATLIKTSLGLYLLGFMGYVFLERIFRRNRFNAKDNIAFVVFSVLSITLVTGYFFYNKHLNETYHGSMFLAAKLPFENWEQVSDYFNYSFKFVLIDEYFVLPQYLMFVAIVVPAIPMLARHNAGKKQLMILLIFLAGSISMGYLMGKQLHVHDYYIVSIFIPLFAFAMLAAVTAIYQSAQSPVGRKALRIAFISTVLIIFFFSDFHLHQRLRPGYKDMNWGISWAANGAKVLDELHISRDEKILVLNEYPPNLALVYLDRRGWHIPPDQWDKMERVKRLMNQLGPGIVVCDEQLGRSVIERDTTLAPRFQTLALKDGIAVFKLKDQR